MIHDVIRAINETDINIASVCQLLERIAAVQGTLSVIVVLDDARYQCILLVQREACCVTSLNAGLLNPG